MRKITFCLLLSVLVCFFSSCKTDVDLYAGYKDVAVIYAMLDYQDDTNYVKIIRAFCGTNDDPIDANEVALIADSSNYPGKLDVRIIELKGNNDHYKPTGRVFVLDTMTVHNKEEGAFYAPDQKIYYTTEPFNVGTTDTRYKYKIVVIKPDGDSVTAQTTMIGCEEFHVLPDVLEFLLAPSDKTERIVFKADDAATLYNVKLWFYYREQWGGQEMQKKYICRSYGMRHINDFPKLGNKTYYFECAKNWLFNELGRAIGGDTIIDVNHPEVVRYIDDFVVTISAGGDELNTYYLANLAQQNSITSVISPYTNINGGYGLFSSRTTIEQTMRLNYTTKRDIFSVAAWGFQEE